jgi:hypothetical protein
MDIHVTDGADYQYDITFVVLGYKVPGIKWLDTTYKTKTDQDLTLNGHIPASFYLQ